MLATVLSFEIGPIGPISEGQNGFELPLRWTIAQLG